jgi:transketolase
VHHTPGVEATTGPLGQGFANGVGFGLAERYLAERYNRPYDEIVDHRVYVICSDGDLMEGVSNEAASLAGQYGLGRLVYFYDDNHITIDGTTSISFSAEDKGARLAAQGWHVQHVDDANDLDALRKAIANAQAETERPSLVVIRSHIAFGAPRAVDTAKAHGSPLGEEEVRATKEALGWDPDEKFVVPDEVREHMNVVERGIGWQQEWQSRFDAWAAKYPRLREDWDQVHTGKPRPGWLEALPEFEPGEELATCGPPCGSRRSRRSPSPGSGRTTRSGSARTGRRTSPSSTTQRCARSRTSGSCGRPTRPRRSARGASPSSGTTGRSPSRSRARRCRRWPRPAPTA